MSVYKLFFISLTIFVLSFCSAQYMESEDAAVVMQKSKNFANTESAYPFEVPHDGQMMRFEFRGRMPMNTWKSFDMEIYSASGEYLFSYQDELWSESGVDSDGKWTERKQHAYFDIRFPKKGQYILYLSDSAASNRSTAKTQYSFRVVPIKGDRSWFSHLYYIFGAIALVCLVVIFNKMENAGKNSGAFIQPKSNHRLSKKSANSSKVYWYIFAGSLAWFGVVYCLAVSHDDSDINYIHYAHRHYNMHVDRSIRQQSLSGANFRAGSSKGGK
ncbi:hypothetical protein [Catenovulum sediminis]|uniref:Uncharacterized protein n=1 Tax=Catenovulum sediminis TaxID=1740262 RepID=A0ABV1RDY7_9ALTE